jgi:hypothetical protein
VPTIQIQLPELHQKQQEILNKRKRFNTVRCGRRFGKTVIATDLLVETALEGFPSAYFTPQYKTLEEVWNEVVNILEPIIVKKNSQLKYIKILGGGQIDFWSLQDGNAPRGRKYKRVIVDEAAYVKVLKDVWNKVLRAFLTDFRGDAYFLSTPNGDNDFKELDERSQKRDNWASFHYPTWSNPYISKDEIEEIKAEFPEDVFNQEYGAEYVNFDGKNFIQYFDYNVNVKPGLTPIKGLDLFECYDFNIANTVLIIQNPDHKTIRVLKEYHADLFDLETLQEQIVLDFPGFLTVVNGDASGSSGSALTKGNRSAYEIIKEKRRFIWEQFNVPSVNPSHLNSYLLSNYLFKNLNIEIDSSCEGLINDIKKVKVQKKNNKFEIIKTDEKLTHHLDCLRYHFNAEHQDKLKHLNIVSNEPEI